MTYLELSQSANRFARHLQILGVAPETLVGVSLERGAETVRGLLAILKAGGAYMPLDPSLPGSRLTQMREEAGIRLVLTDSGNARAFAGTDATLFLVDEMAPAIASRPSTAPPARLQAANIAYAIWTSGSTGRPKSVAVSHGSLGRLCQEAIRAYRLTPADRVLQLASVGFDTSLEQILATLLSGAALMLPEAGTVASSDLIRYLTEGRVSVANLTRRTGIVAVADLAARCALAGGAAIDAQWDSPFLRSLGREPMPRRHYLTMLAAGSPGRLPLPRQVLPARRLIELVPA
jgi:non-ribosomal peptide synthetase component F